MQYKAAGSSHFVAIPEPSLFPQPQREAEKSVTLVGVLDAPDQSLSLLGR